MYAKGIKKLRDSIKDAATYLKNRGEYDELPVEMKREVELLSPQGKGKDPTGEEKEAAEKAVEVLCPDPFVYPG